MSVLDALLESVDFHAPVRFLWVGIHWTVVGSRFCGLAAALTAERLHGEPQVRRAGHLLEKNARQLAEMVRSDRPLEASIGLATLNSLLPQEAEAVWEGDAAELLLEQARDKKVALIGHFSFIPALRRVARQLWVLELHPARDEYPAEAAPQIVPQAEVIAITASTLINHTLDGLLALCPAGATVMLLGPSTPLSPVLFEYGITLLSGVRVVDEDAVLRTVGQGATFPQIQGVRRVTLKKP